MKQETNYLDISIALEITKSSINKKLKKIYSECSWNKQQRLRFKTVFKNN
jgi:hypothetical protein